MALNYNTPFGGRVEYFLQEIISTPAGALPKGAQWVLSFEGLYGETAKSSPLLPVDAIKKGVMLEPQRWRVNESIDILLQERFQLTKNCMLVQAVQIPGESTTVNVEGTQINGFLRSYIGGGRDTYAAMQMSFLDTNISFVDNTIRAWVLATGHLGLLARKGKDNYRCNFSVYKLGVTSRDEPPSVLQKYTFYGACPVSIEAEEWNYSASTTFVPRNVTFIYHYYTLDTSTDNKILSKDKQHQTEQRNLKVHEKVFKKTNFYTGTDSIDISNRLMNQYGLSPMTTMESQLAAKIKAEETRLTSFDKDLGPPVDPPDIQALRSYNERGQAYADKFENVWNKSTTGVKEEALKVYNQSLVTYKGDKMAASVEAYTYLNNPANNKAAALALGSDYLKSSPITTNSQQPPTGNQTGGLSQEYLKQNNLTVYKPKEQSQLASSASQIKTEQKPQLPPGEKTAVQTYLNSTNNSSNSTTSQLRVEGAGTSLGAGAARQIQQNRESLNRQTTQQTTNSNNQAQQPTRASSQTPQTQQTVRTQGFVPPDSQLAASRNNNAAPSPTGIPTERWSALTNQQQLSITSNERLNPNSPNLTPQQIVDRNRARAIVVDRYIATNQTNPSTSLNAATSNATSNATDSSTTRKSLEAAKRELEKIKQDIIKSTPR